jgi:hypothetical protein
MKVLGVILAVIGALMLAGAIRVAVMQSDLSQSHDLSKILGGGAVSALILLCGVAMLRKKQ